MPTMTINYTTQEVARMSKAFGEIYGLGRDATQEEVRQATMKWQKETTQNWEHGEAQSNAIINLPPPDPFNPT